MLHAHVEYTSDEYITGIFFILKNRLSIIEYKLEKCGRRIELERLADMEREIVTENHNIIYSFLKSYNYSIEEYYGAAAIGLVKAVKTYNPEKGKLSTWAYRIMYNEVGITFRKTNLRGNVTSIVSYDKLILDTGESSSVLLDTIITDSNMQENMEFISDISSRVHLLSVEEIEILALKASGETKKSIAKKFEYSPSHITNILNRSYNILKGNTKNISKKRTEYIKILKGNKELERRFYAAYKVILQVAGEI